MGFLTTITIYNDGVHLINPDSMTAEQKDIFIRKIYDACAGLDPKQRKRKSIEIGFNHFANMINVQFPRHADDVTVFVHYGNCVLNINAYDGDFKTLSNNMPDVLKKYIDIAQSIITDAKKKLKEKE